MRNGAWIGAGLLAIAGVLALNPATTGVGAYSAGVPGVSAIASCDFRSVVEELVNAPRYADEREALQQRLTTPEILSMRERVEALDARMDAAREADNRADWEAAYDEWDTLTDELWPLEDEISEAVMQQRTRDTADAYELAMQTARELATDMGYDAIVQGDTNPLYNEPAAEESDEFTDLSMMDEYERMQYFRAQRQDPGIVHERFALRPVPVLPEGTDITDDVRYELGLD